MKYIFVLLAFFYTLPAVAQENQTKEISINQGFDKVWNLLIDAYSLKGKDFKIHSKEDGLMTLIVQESLLCSKENIAKVPDALAVAESKYKPGNQTTLEPYEGISEWNIHVIKIDGSHTTIKINLVSPIQIKKYKASSVIKKSRLSEAHSTGVFEKGLEKLLNQ